jgi:hypothetical protein
VDGGRILEAGESVGRDERPGAIMDDVHTQREAGHEAGEKKSEDGELEILHLHFC